MPRPCKLSGQKDAGTPRRQWPRRTPVFTPSQLLAGPRGPPPRGPDEHRRGPPCGPRALRRAAAAPLGRGEPPGSAPFLTDPNMASAAAAAAAARDDTSPRRRRSRDRGGEAPGKFRFSSPGPPGGRPTTKPRLHLPSRARTAAEAKVRLLLVPGAARGLSLPPAPASQCVQPAALRSRRAPDAAGGRASQTLAGDPPAPPVEAHNGRRGWPLPCARAHKRASTHTPGAGAGTITPPALAPRPFWPAPPPRPGSPARLGRGGGASAEATPAWAAGARDWLLCSESRARALTRIGCTCDVFYLACRAQASPRKRRFTSSRSA